MNYYLLRLHRWTTLVFALPLAVVIVTGLLLSLPPILHSASIKPGSLTLQKVEALLDKHDPQGKARSIRVDTFQNQISIGGVGPDGSVDLDLTSGAEAEDEHWLSEWMGASRGIHQRLIYDLGWLVIASTAAMMALILFGVLMGLPRLANTVSGWHKATAWFLLPLVILSPLTALLMAAGVTLSGTAPRTQGAPVREALRMISEKHDLSGLEWIRARGGRMIARVNDGAHHHVYVVSREGLTPAPTNWPRTFHEGTFLGPWGGVMNLVLSFAFILLMATGLWIWARRTFRTRKRRERAPARPIPQAAE